MIAVIGMALAVIIVYFWDKFMDKLYRPLRVGIVSCMEWNCIKGKLEKK
jgi:hypothetical protein